MYLPAKADPYVIFVPAGVQAAQVVAQGPEAAVKFGFLVSHLATKVDSGQRFLFSDLDWE